jgi:pyruvate/2-oxoglutarate dehydrogenase complex dihydrolipoamide dehydrogenase (E3) component
MRYDYDIVIIGGGAAGLSAASKAIETGAKAVIVEKDKLGGVCTWSGCIPSKALLKSAKVFSDTLQLSEFGISPGMANSYNADMVMSHVRSIIIKMGEHAAPEYYEQGGMNVLFGKAVFIDGHTVRVNEETVTGRHFLICTGSRPQIPPIEGLREVDYLTNKNLFDLNYLPASIAILGGGPIGVEIGQALLLLGVKVTIIETADRLLPREDRETAVVLEEMLLRNGLKVCTGSKTVRFSKTDGQTEVTIEDRAGNRSGSTVERVLVATGRLPEIEELQLGKAGIQYTSKGIVTDDSMKTSVENIYACGDAVGPYKFTHMAAYQAGIAMENILFGKNTKADYHSVPWCIFTKPELAHFGPTEEEARAQYGNTIQVYRAEYKNNDRAISDLEDAGFAKVICDLQGHILGAHVVGAKADEVIHEYILAKANGITLDRLSKAIHIYPTISRIIKATAEQYKIRERLKEKEKVAATT